MKTKLLYNKEQYVPVVVKNRDYLIGFFDAVSSFSSMFEIDWTALDSMRLNDILPNGQRRRHLTEQQILDVMSESYNEMNIKENKSEMEEDAPFLEVHCSCGNYVKYESPDEIPSMSRRCEICGKLMIDYTGHDQDEYTYDGELEKMFIGMDIDMEDESDEESDDDLED